MPAYGMKKSKGGGGGRSIGPSNVDPRQVARDRTIEEDTERALAAKKTGKSGQGEGGDAGAGHIPILKAFNTGSKNNAVMLSMFCSTASASVRGYGCTGTKAHSGGWSGFFSRSTASSSATGTNGRGSTSGGSGLGGGGFMSAAGGFFSSRR